MKIAYGKLGRSFPLVLENASSVGGDIEVINLLNLLRRDHEVHLIGRNQMDATLENVVNHWTPGQIFNQLPYVRDENREPDDPVYLDFIRRIDDASKLLPSFDAWVIWLGQHGTVCSFIPPVQDGRDKEDLTRPLMSHINYCLPIVRMINSLDVRPFWLCPDPRNLLKLRDISNPDQRVGLAQYNTKRSNLFWHPERGLKRNEVKYKYSGIEMLAVPKVDTPVWDQFLPNRKPFGILVNEGRSNLGNKGRLELVKRWIPNYASTEIDIIGHWSDKSQLELKRAITPVDVTEVLDVLSTWRSTVTFPANAGGWATSKPWECFSAGTICFKHPEYDDQGHIFSMRLMPDELYRFLRPFNGAELRKRVEELEDEATYRKYAVMQWDYLQASRERLKDGAGPLMEAVHEGITAH